MALNIGEAITARQVEFLTGTWPVDVFTAMCDALAWAESGGRWGPMPSFAGRINVADRGVDASWEVSLEALTDSSVPTPILGPGWNVLQYKLRDVGAQDRRRIVSDLRRKLKGALADVARKHGGRWPDRYVLFVNVDLEIPQLEGLRQTIRHDAETGADIGVEVVDAGTLAVLLNNQPHLRAAFFGERGFRTWQRAMDDHAALNPARPHTPLIGRTPELESVRDALLDVGARILIIAGPPFAGKSRLALEATRDRQASVVVALDPHSTSIPEYRHLLGTGSEAVVIVEDPPSEQMDGLIGLATSEPQLKLVVTTATPTTVPNPSFGSDERIRVVTLAGLDDEHATDLLKSTGEPLDPSVGGWIIEQSGGLPGILLAAATVGQQLRVDEGGFRSQVGREIARRVGDQLGDQALDSLRVLSLLTFVGVDGERFGGELDRLCRLAGGGPTGLSARQHLHDLHRAGIISRRGSFAAVEVPLLANHLAAGALRADSRVALSVLAQGEGSIVGRFLDRLSQLDDDVTSTLWESMFDADGPLASMTSASHHPSLLRHAAEAVPQRTLSLLESDLQPLTREQRLAMRGDLRRQLMWTIESLLIQPATSRGAVRLLWLLAEAETETWGNNATGVLAETFRPMHPQIPLELDERLRIARELFDQSETTEGRLVLVQALSNSLNHSTYPILRGGRSSAPAYFRTSYVLQDIWAHLRARTALLFEWSQHAEPRVRSAAQEALPEVVAELMKRGLYTDGVRWFDQLVDMAHDPDQPLNAVPVAFQLHDLHWILEHHVEAARNDEERERTENALREIDRLQQDLAHGSLLSRLQVWASRWETEELLAVHEGKPAPFEPELREIADVLIATPVLLDGDLLDWLMSPAAGKGMAFFEILGERDSAGVLLDPMIQFGGTQRGSYALGAYYRGWAKRDGAAARDDLDRRAQAAGPALALSVAYATIVMDPTPSDVARLHQLLAAGMVDRTQVAAMLGAMFTVRRWIDGLGESAFEGLMVALAGPDCDNADRVIKLLSLWHHVHRRFTPGMRALGWGLLKSPHVGQDTTEPWQPDNLASRLARAEPEAGFAFLEHIMARETLPTPGGPFDSHYRHELLDALGKIDRERLIRLSLDIARRSDASRYAVTAALQEVLGEDRDVAILVDEGLQSVANAHLVAECLTIDQRNLVWPVAFALVEAFPDDNELQVRLTNVVRGGRRATFAFAGSYATVLRNYSEEIQQVLPTAPPAARAWLREVQNRLGAEIGRRIIWEYDDDIADLRQYIEDPQSPRRRWAIERILKYADWSEARKLLSLEDIVEVMPEIDLPDKKRRALERALPVWLGE